MERRRLKIAIPKEEIANGMAIDIRKWEMDRAKRILADDIIDELFAHDGAIAYQISVDEYPDYIPLNRIIEVELKSSVVQTVEARMYEYHPRFEAMPPIKQPAAKRFMRWLKDEWRECGKQGSMVIHKGA